METPLHISVTNLNSGKYEIKSSGTLTDYITASCALPFIFKPVTINKIQYVDGGLLNNLPIEPLEEKCDKIIGVSVSSHEPRPKINGRISVAERCMKLAIWNTV